MRWAISLVLALNVAGCAKNKPAQVANPDPFAAPVAANVVQQPTASANFPQYANPAAQPLPQAVQQPPSMNPLLIPTMQPPAGTNPPLPSSMQQPPPCTNQPRLPSMQQPAGMNPLPIGPMQPYAPPGAAPPMTSQPLPAPGAIQPSAVPNSPAAPAKPSLWQWILNDRPHEKERRQLEGDTAPRSVYAD
jgi:hypothetical protein